MVFSAQRSACVVNTDFQKVLIGVYVIIVRIAHETTHDETAKVRAVLWVFVTMQICNIVLWNRDDCVFVGWSFRDSRNSRAVAQTFFFLYIYRDKIVKLPLTIKRVLRVLEPEFDVHKKKKKVFSFFWRCLFCWYFTWPADSRVNAAKSRRLKILLPY